MVGKGLGSRLGGNNTGIFKGLRQAMRSNFMQLAVMLIKVYKRMKFSPIWFFQILLSPHVEEGCMHLVMNMVQIVGSRLVGKSTIVVQA